jgi:hypothetical protein
LAPRLPEALLPAALDAARAIRDEEARARALTALAPRLAAEQQAQTFAAALDAARAIRAEGARASALEALAPRLAAREFSTPISTAGKGLTQFAH